MFRDGPLTRRPPERIRYATGKCALGPLLVACSDKGVVTLMIRAKAAQQITGTIIAVIQPSRQVAPASRKADLRLTATGIMVSSRKVEKTESTVAAEKIMAKVPKSDAP